MSDARDSTPLDAKIGAAIRSVRIEAGAALRTPIKRFLPDPKGVS